METNKQKQGETVLAYLEREREEWLPIHERAVRADHMNAETNAEEQDHMKQIDACLDELNALGFFALQGVAHGGTTI